MTKRSLLMWIFLVMPLMFLLVYGCSTGDTSTVSSPTPSTMSTSPEITTTPSHDNELYFQDYQLPLSPSHTSENIPPYLFVITHTQSPLPDRWAYSTYPHFEGYKSIEDVNFSEDFIVVVCMGVQSMTGPKITVESIWQIGDTIYVQTNFDKGGPTYLPMISEPAYRVKVSKDNMTQFGEITFIMLDQNGLERARTTCEIPE